MNIYDMFEMWKLKAEKETDEKLQIFQSDSAEKYRKLICDWTLKRVKFEFTISYTLKQNSFSECLNCTITESLQSMLYDAQLPLKFWGEAVKTVNYLQNCLSLRDKWGVKTSYELYKGFKLSVEHLHSFDCVVYTHISKERQVKLKNTAYREIFVDYCKSNEQFQVWNLSMKRVETWTHLVFIEHEKDSQLLTNSEQYIKNWEVSIDSDIVNDDYSPILTPQKLAQRCTESERALTSDSEVIESVRDFLNLSMRIQKLDFSAENQDKNSQTDSENSEDNREAQNSSSEASETIYVHLRSVRENSESVEQNSELTEQTSTEKMSWYEQILKLNSHYVNMTIQKHIHEPFSYEEAMRSPTHQRQWAQVIEEELISLTLNGTWEVVELPKECLSITSKWVFKVKYTFSDLIEWFKACLVIRGFSQHYEIDYKETFASTLHFDSLCMLLAIAAHEDLHIH